MEDTITTDVVLDVTQKLLRQNAGDEATEYIILAFTADILDISIDKLLEILEL